MKKSCLVSIFSFIFLSAFSRQDHYVSEMKPVKNEPVVNYLLKVDPADSSSIYVEMDIVNAPDTFRVAMFAHPEYDDRYWRYIKDLSVETPDGAGYITRQDSALWRITITGGHAVLHYRVELPKSEYPSAWRPFISSSGALIGGPHSFMFIVDATNVASHVQLEIPKQWTIATSLEPTADPYIFYAANTDALVDAPILAGNLRMWNFEVDHTPHTIAYHTAHNILFDTTRLVNNLQAIVEQVSALFHGLPYNHYFFLLRDEAYGALEHSNSVILGAPSADLTKDMKDAIAEIAHEYFHAWNMMRIRPVEYGDIDYKTPALSRGLWWSEGLTMFYADLLLRRAGLPVYDSSRILHLQNLIGEYYSNPGNQQNVEQVSMAEYVQPGLLGDYIASTHVQGELIANMLDLIIRNATNNDRSIDDVMRKMFEDFGHGKGFTAKDIEQTVSAVCSCSAQAFFDNYITGSKHFDFDAYLQLLGLHTEVSWKNVLDENNKPAADLRVYSFILRNETALRIGIMDPSNCWGKAGLHTGDKLLSINDSAMNNRSDFYTYIRHVHIGDTLSVAIQKKTGIWKTTVVITGYKHASVEIRESKHTTPKQQQLRAAWMAGKN